MKSQLLIFITMCFSIINSEAQQKNDWICIPGVRVGSITNKTSLKDLKLLFGVKNLTTTMGQLTIDNEEENVTYIFKGQPNEVIIYWKNNEFYNPRIVEVGGSESDWKLQEGIRIGTTLEQLNSINSAPFIFSGYEWDYAGTLTSWTSGKLAKYKNKLWLIINSNSPNELNDEFYKRFIGDKDIKSNIKDLKKFKFFVGKMYVTL